MAEADRPAVPVTPMMAQYHALKAEAGDCLLFYRMGDFFELFFDDAKAAARTLDIALTSRGEHGGNAVPMCGVPVHAAETYLAKLIRAGHRVAIAEQVETPEQAKKRGGSKALVARAIVRFVTAGTLTEDSLLEARSANWLVAIGSAGGEVALAAADISTGRFEVGIVGAAGLSAELARLAPAEVLVAEGAAEAEMLPEALRHVRNRRADSSPGSNRQQRAGRCGCARHCAGKARASSSSMRRRVTVWRYCVAAMAGAAPACWRQSTAR
jgi:DNA mismatch repair protein MutS